MTDAPSAHAHTPWRDYASTQSTVTGLPGRAITQLSPVIVVAKVSFRDVVVPRGTVTRMLSE